MCEYCENNYPMGGYIDKGDLSSVCVDQIAESLRDAIRSITNITEDQGYEIDRLINELVIRAKNVKKEEIKKIISDLKTANEILDKMKKIEDETI